MGCGYFNETKKRCFKGGFCQYKLDKSPEICMLSPPINETSKVADEKIKKYRNFMRNYTDMVLNDLDD